MVSMATTWQGEPINRLALSRVFSGDVSAECLSIARIFALPKNPSRVPTGRLKHLMQRKSDPAHYATPKKRDCETDRTFGPAYVVSPVQTGRCHQAQTRGAAVYLARSPALAIR
jgi:hypothetical protein